LQALQQKAARKASEGKLLATKDISSINKDITTLTKDSKAINNAATSLIGLKDRGTAASQLAAIFKFMKALDPASVVREAEQDQARSTGGITDRFISTINQIRGEGKLAEVPFNDLVDTAIELSNSASTASIDEVNRFLDTFGDVMTQNQRKTFEGRIPQEIKQRQGPVEVDPPATDLSDDDIRQRLGL